jgi:hypothetical protein
MRRILPEATVPPGDRTLVYRQVNARFHPCDMSTVEWLTFAPILPPIG